MGNDLFLTATTPDTDRWLTPRWVLDELGRFDLDPCGAPDWSTADEVWTPESIGDGLALPWHGRVWLNPPYGSAATPWLYRMAEHRSGIALLFARTDTAAWHDLVFPYAAAVLFIRGRLNFVRPGRDDDKRQAGEGNSGAPSALVAYSSADAAILRDSKIRGHLMFWSAR